MEVPYHFVDSKSAFDAAALPPLGVEPLPVAFAFALLDTFSTPKRPRVGGVGFAYLVTGVAAARFLGGRWRWGGVA